MFIDSHDEDRFLCSQQDVPLYKNALAFIYYVEGMPIVYYGMEQGMGGNRDPLWHAGYSEDAELYVYIKMLNWWVRQGHRCRSGCCNGGAGAARSHGRSMAVSALLQVLQCADLYAALSLPLSQARAL